MPKRIAVPAAHRYLQQAQSWHDHLREAGDDLGANEIALTMLPSMWVLNIHEPGRELVKALVEKIDDRSEAFFQARFWDASYIMQSGKNNRAMKILQTLETQVRGTKHEKLLPQILERMGEAFRNLAIIKRPTACGGWCCKSRNASRSMWSALFRCSFI